MLITHLTLDLCNYPLTQHCYQSEAVAATLEAPAPVLLVVQLFLPQVLSPLLERGITFHLANQEGKGPVCSTENK